MQKRIIALDVGDRRIGIAVSDPLGITAQPVETYTRVGYGPDVRRVQELCAQYETDEILCGLPKNMDGTQGFQIEKVKEFAGKLTEAGLHVSFYDERMTTMLAEGALLEANMRRGERKKKIDMVAAVFILQSWLDNQAALAKRNENAQEEDDEEMAEEESILEMEDSDGNPVRFQLTANIRYENADYVLVSAMDATPDFEVGESFIMELTADENGEECYAPVDDETLLEAVYNAYLKQSEA